MAATQQQRARLYTTLAETMGDEALQVDPPSGANFHHPEGRCLLHLHDEGIASEADEAVSEAKK